ncbi:hypothetical protein [Ruegeria sp. HKCCD6109]|uniref:hypothetical protein n=1 Tax=Ruegeria sp. HKCCD6109 TaxID=2683017 RepID=UPI0014924261|nr:hypothetical protein [Ruegeria sp. HKCCD6109]NOD65427.1 hypothetical protein [Ruegeria sp. HKCCD6109]
MSEEGPNENTEEFEKRCEVDAITVAFLLVKAAQFASEDELTRRSMSAEEWNKFAPKQVYQG